MKTDFKFKVLGHVKIIDVSTGQLILSKTNAIHPQNIAKVFARAISRDTNGSIYKMVFGNGGTFLNSSQTLIYRTPNTIGGTAGLYNQTYEVQVDEQAGGTPATNSVTSAPAPAPSISSIVTVVSQLNVNEPAGQAAADNVTTNFNSGVLVGPDADALYVFDEIGLKTEDDLLLSHLIFSPIEKTANRAFAITYTLTMSAS